jgi:hypothetical protein
MISAIFLKEIFSGTRGDPVFGRRGGGGGVLVISMQCNNAWRVS